MTESGIYHNWKKIFLKKLGDERLTGERVDVPDILSFTPMTARNILDLFYLVGLAIAFSFGILIVEMLCKRFQDICKI